MRIVINEPKKFIDAINVINELIAETEIRVNNERLSIISLDPANVALASLTMYRTGVEFMSWDVDKEYRLGIKVGDLKSILRRGKDSSLELSSDGQKLDILFKDKKGKTKKFSLALIELEKETKIPELKFGVELALEHSDLKDSIEDANIVSDACAFVVDDTFRIIAKGELNESVSDTPAVIKYLGDVTSIRSKYSLEYLSKIIKTQLDNLKISFGKDYPLRLQYSDKTGTVELLFILAPRIEND